MAPIHPPKPPSSLLHIERISQYVPVPPSALTFAHPALCAEIYSPLLLSYYPPVQGIILAYENVVLSAEAPRSHIPSPSSSRKRKRRHHHHHHDDDEDAQASDAEKPETGSGEVVLARQIDEYAAPHVWATASLLVWRPQAHVPVAATLTHASATHVTLSHLNTFAISVLKERLPEGWVWHQESTNAKEKGWDGRVVDKGGWWVDGDGEKVTVGTQMQVWILSWDAKWSGEGRKGWGAMGVVGSLRGNEDGAEVGERRDGRNRTTAS